MEELCCRFPVLGDLMFNNLDDQSLSNSKVAGRVVSQFVINERFFWIRIIQNYYEELSEFKTSWEMVIRRTSVDILKKLNVVFLIFFSTLDSIFLDFKDAEDGIKHVLYMDSNYLNKSNRNRNRF